jgi:hypothetical protein
MMGGVVVVPLLDDYPVSFVSITRMPLDAEVLLTIP